MKQKTLLILSIMTLAAITITGCGKKNEVVEPEPTPTPPEIIEEVENEIYNDGSIKVIMEDNKVISTGLMEGEWIVESYDETLVNVETKENEITISPIKEGIVTIGIKGIINESEYLYYIDAIIDETITIIPAVRYSPNEDIDNEISDNTSIPEDISAIIDTIYSNMPEDSYPMVANVEVDITNSETMMYNFGVESMEGLEKAVLSDPMMTSIAYSLSVLKFDTNENAQAALTILEENAPINKWVCVSAEKVSTKIINDTYVIFVMSGTEVVDLINQITIE